MYRLIAILLLFANTTFGQDYLDYISDHQGRYFGTLGLMFNAGVWDGVSQSVAFHYSDFKEVFPCAKDQFWNNNISWKNKYKDVENGDYSPKFFGSTTFLAWTTDGYHLSRTISNTSMLAGVILDYSGKKKLHWYLYDFVICSIVKSVGFHLTYTVIF